MKSISNIAPQGDVLFQRVDCIPSDARLRPKAEEYIVAHSETGHHHIARGPGLRCYDTEDPLVSYLELRGPAQVRHERSFDTHETIELLARVNETISENAKAKRKRGEKTEDPEPAYYKVIRQRQHTPDGWVRVVD